jgi:hypothetical protein
MIHGGVVVDNRAAFEMSVRHPVGIGDYMPSAFHVPQNPVFAGPDGCPYSFVVKGSFSWPQVDGLHPRGIQ